MRGHPLAALLGSMGNDDEDEGVKLTNEEKIAKLQEFVDRQSEYAIRALSGEGWKVGDVVHATKDADFRGRGEPHVVIEVIREGYRHWNDAGSNHNGETLDVRIAMFRGGLVVPHWVNGLYLEAFDVNDPKGVLKD